MQLTFDDYIKRVSTAGTIVDELMICLLSQMYKIHIGLRLQDGRVWTTHQIDDAQAITIWATCACGFLYNLTVPNPPEVVHGHGAQSPMLDIPKPPIREKVVKEKTKEKVVKEKAKDEVIKE